MTKWENLKKLSKEPAGMITDDNLLEKATLFFKGLIQSLNDGSFTHYTIPHRVQEDLEASPPRR